MEETTTTTLVELLPKEYGCVIIALVLYFFLNFWMGMKVSKARKKYNVPYPTMYLIESDDNKEAKIFNCIQRGHQNSLEMMPVFFVTLLLGGLQHPVVASSLGVLYTIARFFFFRGYSTGVPAQRNKIGGVNYVALFGLILCTASLGIQLSLKEIL